MKIWIKLRRLSLKRFNNICARDIKRCCIGSSINKSLVLILKELIRYLLNLKFSDFTVDKYLGYVELFTLIY